ncbi:MAG: xylulokinase [Saccharofermentanales bacterium]
MEYLLGIDIGTSGTKTVVFDHDCKVIASESYGYPMSQPHNGWAEQDPHDWWDAVCSTCKGVLAKSGIHPADIKGIGLSGQMHGLVMLDEDGEVLRPSIIWCDQRTQEECDEITRRVGAERLIEITANPALTGFTASKILWVRNHEPEIYEKCKHILLPKDYIRFCMTGDYATDVSDASGMQLLDIGERRWSDEVLEALDIDRDLLGKVYESVEITGFTSVHAAESAGLEAGIPVVGGAGDNAAAAVGTGVVKDGKAFTTIGTSGVIFAHTSELVIDPKGRVHTFCCAVPGAWHVMGVTQAAGLSLEWFKKEFCAREIMDANDKNISVYRIMDEEASQIRVGCDDLIYLPYLMGERTPHLDPDCRGVFFGLSAMHTRAHLIRSVMEGVAFSLKDCMSVLNEMGVAPDEMLACGGGGKSPLWRQMLADAYDCPVITLAADEGPALGVAILAGTGTGMFSSVENACEKIIARKDMIMPIPDNNAKMERNYLIFKSLYVQLKNTFKSFKY